MVTIPVQKIGSQIPVQRIGNQFNNFRFSWYF